MRAMTPIDLDQGDLALLSRIAPDVEVTGLSREALGQVLQGALQRWPGDSGGEELFRRLVTELANRHGIPLGRIH